MDDLQEQDSRIVWDVLSAIRQGHEGGVGVSAIMRKADISYSHIVEVLDELLRARLIDEVAGRKFKITTAGLKLVGEWENFEEFAKSFGLGL
jgi:predicted transcriptional regulator